MRHKEGNYLPINNADKIHSLLPLLSVRKTDFQATIAANSAALLKEHYLVKFLGY